MAVRGSTGKALPSTIREVLERTLARVGLDRRLEDYRIFEGWDEVVGAAIARNAQPSRLDNKRLVVVVRSSTWLQELGMLRRDLCDRLNDWMGREIITEIFLVVGKLEAEPVPAQQPGVAGTHSAHSAPHTKRPDDDVATEGAAPAHPQDGGDDIAAAFERLWQAKNRHR